jgi:dihydroflavonol-4-reductase
MVVVTGANGLLGRYICQQLLSNNISVIGTKRKESKIPEELMPLAWKDADILEPLDLQEAFQGATTVIHTAALVSFNPRLSEKLYETNVLGTRNVVNACLRNQVSHLIHVSSVAALGRVKGELYLMKHANGQMIRWNLTTVNPNIWLSLKFIEGMPKDLSRVSSIHL